MLAPAMKMVRRLLIASLLVLGVAPCAPADDVHPALYSFADLYRLTVGAATDEGRFSGSAAEPQVRVAAQASALEPRFTITPVPGPRAWVLVIAGLAAAAWVAHRRLTYAY
jgi:hypothetical protein